MTRLIARTEIDLPSGVQISDTPIRGKMHFEDGYMNYWSNGRHNNPEGTMNEILSRLNTIRDREPFDLEKWTEFAEIGHDILWDVSPKLREAFLRVTSHDKKRRIDAFQLCKSRIEIIRTLQKRNPRQAVQAVYQQLSQLPFRDTFVRTEKTLREGVFPDPDMRLLLQRYRLALEMLLAELLPQIPREPDPVLLDRIDCALEHFVYHKAHVNGNGRPPRYLRHFPYEYYNFIESRSVPNGKREEPSGNGQHGGVDLEHAIAQ